MLFPNNATRRRIKQPRLRDEAECIFVRSENFFAIIVKFLETRLAPGRCALHVSDTWREMRLDAIIISRDEDSFSCDSEIRLKRGGDKISESQSRDCLEEKEKCA